ncbi:hypothetical protein BDZ91DRAFT_726124 [Kalaharituber pfeilii]|nr:hypothetical protein BDZ91DRAFT_726124 [Kalaharituber pfeilii]
MWKDTSNPKWGRDISFPKGTCVFKLLFTDATEDEIPILKGAPTMDAVIFTGVNPATGKPTGRNDFASKLRLLQVDFAVKDHRSPIGWIFGSFVYDGSKKHPNPWQRIIPIGLMWGNSPNLTQAAYEAGERPYEQWMNPEATNLMKKLGGSKPMPGWNGRFNGPVDNFISSCISCHSMAQKAGETKMTPDVIQSPPGHYCPVDDKKLMQWFRNIPAGEPFTKDATSGDYSLQLMIGYHRFHHWKNSRLLYERLFVGTKFIFTGEKMPGSLEKREALRESQFTGHNHSKRTSAWRPLRNYNIPLSETYIDRKPLGG